VQGSTSDDRISVKAFSDLEMSTTLGGVWNRIVRESGASAFLLAEFLVQFMKFRVREGWHPLLLLLSADGVPVGVAPLITRKHLGVRTTRIPLPSWLSPDFVLEDRYRGQCIEQIVQIVFQKEQSDLLELTLPAESPNGRLLKLQCESRNLHYKVQDLPASEQAHRLVAIYPHWDGPFVDSIGKPISLSSQGHDFRKNINRMKRNLNRPEHGEFTSSTT